MATTELTEPAPLLAGSRGAPRIGWEGLLLVVPLAAHLPWLVQQARQLWLRPHYQFFPLVLLGAGVLAYARLRDMPSWRRGRPWLTALGLALDWVLLAAAELLDSPWLGSVAALGLLPVLAYAWGGGAACRRLWPAWVLLLVAVPPPFELDRNLVLWLQALTTRWASAVLDVTGVYHVAAGNVIEVDGQKLLVEQACSGVNSLFSVLACTLFWVFLTRRGPVRAALLLTAAVGWVLAANMARVVSIAMLETRWHFDATTGWRHEAIGVLFFAAAVGLLLSTDQLLAFFGRTTPPAPPDAPPRAAEPAGRPGGLWPLAVAAPAYLLLLAGHWALADRTAAPVAATPPVPGAEFLPTSVAGWERQEFGTQTRSPGSFFGEESQTWSYRRGERTALVSLDHPFPAWHDLTRCYTSQGWQVAGQAVLTAHEAPGGFVEVRLSKPAYRYGYLVFCEFDGAGRPLTARAGGADLSLTRHESVLRRWRQRLGGERPEGPPEPVGPVYQFQVFVETFAPLTAEGEGVVRDLFLRAQSVARSQWDGGGSGATGR